MRLQRPLTIVGHARPSNLRIRSPFISVCHCAIYREHGRIWVIDLLSRNGTHMGDRPIDVAELHQGHVLSLHNVQIEWIKASSKTPPSSLCHVQGVEALSPRRSSDSAAGHAQTRHNVPDVDQREIMPRLLLQTAGLEQTRTSDRKSADQEYSRCLQEGHQTLQLLAAEKQDLQLRQQHWDRPHRQDMGIQRDQVITREESTAREDVLREVWSSEYELLKANLDQQREELARFQSDVEKHFEAIRFTQVRQAECCDRLEDQLHEAMQQSAQEAGDWRAIVRELQASVCELSSSLDNLRQHIQGFEPTNTQLPVPAPSPFSAEDLPSLRSVGEAQQSTVATDEARSRADQLAQQVCNRLVQEKWNRERRARLWAITLALVVLAVSVGGVWLAMSTA